MEIPKNKSKNKRKEKLKEKHCQFPISEKEMCGKLFYGTARSCYCLEHRQRKYRTQIDKIRSKTKDNSKSKESHNQIINHSANESHDLEMTCALDGCSNVFMVKLIPNIQVYPKYCEEHRNPYKRKRHLELFRKKNGSDQM